MDRCAYRRIRQIQASLSRTTAELDELPETDNPADQLNQKQELERALLRERAQADKLSRAMEDIAFLILSS